MSRILTLVFTDLADSTALKTRYGDEAAGALIARHRERLRGIADDCGGRIVEWAGDGCFLTFESSSAAVHFALRLQEAHGDTPELPPVRAGLHIGEVSERGVVGEDGHAAVEGLAVDLAARIAGLARPSQVLMSAAVADSARPRVNNTALRRPIVWRSCGNYVLKGIGEPVAIRAVGLEGLSDMTPPVAGEKAAPVSTRDAAPPRARVVAIAAPAVLLLVVATVFLVIHYRSPAPREPASAPQPATAEAASATLPAASGALNTRPAIAVLPFDNLSPDPEQAFFGDGLAEDLITRLAAWRAFPVIARNSSFQYRGGNHDVKQVGQELGARYLVEGSVRRAADRIRVTAQLIDSTSGEHVWAETYDRVIADIFALQDEISEGIAASLVDDLTRAEGERARQQGTHDLEAWGLYQLGLQYFDRYTLDDFGKARELFARAAERDPRFATAFGYFALAGFSELILGRPGPREDFVASLMKNARKAEELDPRDPVALLGLAGAYLAAGEGTQALDLCKRAAELNPSMPQAWIWVGFLQAVTGEAEAAVVSTQRAQRLNPRGNMVWIYDNFALAYWQLGRYGEALEAAQRLVAAQPDYFTGYLYLAMNNVALGRLDEARAAIVEGKRVRPDLSLALMQDYLGVSRPEIDARRNAALRQAGLE